MAEIKEECGVFGIYDLDGNDVTASIYYGLTSLQHRGQEACGLAVSDTKGPIGNVKFHKDLGLVSEVLREETLHKMSGDIGIGHVRYSTTGASVAENAQPLVLSYVKGSLALAHNGNLVNTKALKWELIQSGAVFHTTTDSEVIAFHAVLNTAKKLQGAYGLVIMSPRKLIGVRDPYGLKPLCLGKRDNAYVLASESCALTSVGAEFIRDILPGEMVTISHEGIKSDLTLANMVKTRAHCVFEYIYFARPDSVIEGASVHEARLRAGAFLALEHPVQADIVIGVPDSGIDAAIGYSHQSGIPYGIGFIKNKYIGRTFISPGQSSREDKVRIKLNAVASVVKGKRVVLIDDSIVRGTTSGRIVKLLRDAGATEVHMRVSAPPFLNPCYYGTDIDSREHLIACHHSIKEISDIIGTDSLGYLSVENAKKLAVHANGCECGYCTACFSGEYPTNIPTEMHKDKFDRKISESKEKTTT